MVNETPKQFMLGRGERLTETIPYIGGPSAPVYPYTPEEVGRRLSRNLREQIDLVRELNTRFCPNDQVVSEFTVHPSYISRSHFPESLLRRFGLRLLGSKPIQIQPDKGKGSDIAGGAISTSLFVAGTKSSFEALTDTVAEGSVLQDGVLEDFAIDLLKIEKISHFSAAKKVFGEISNRKQMLEMILHFDSLQDGSWEDDFFSLSQELGLELDIGSDYQSRGLLFIPAEGTKEQVEEIANYSFVRAIRPMPKLRVIATPRVLRSQPRIDVELPTENALDPNCKIAIFDGGLTDTHPFGKWVNYIEPPSSALIGDAVASYLKHGTAVTSSVLFGTITDGRQSRPFANIDHYRVLGGSSDTKLYSTMLYIDEVLSQTTYPMANFSIGPHEVAGNDNVTAWTAMLDDHFGSGDTLATIAVGNDGEEAWPANRIQIPSDCVNALAIGASDRSSKGWQRAEYSSIGPGRNPGYTKPDLLHFGGTDSTPFRLILSDSQIAEGSGTSYSAPAVLRVASGLRAHYGTDLSPQAIRALLIHSAQYANQNRDEVGWGLVQNDINAIVTCGDGMVRVVYQGKLEPSKVIRAPIPLPDQELLGYVNITATFCYVCKTDPNTPGEYTRGGLDVTFRPDKSKFNESEEGKKSVNPKSASFFKRHPKSSEATLRLDAHKWDTVMHNTGRKRGSSLNEPVFDVHYIAREPGMTKSPSDASSLPFALIVTIECAKIPNLYALVQERYRNRLFAMRPSVELPIRI